MIKIKREYLVMISSLRS